MPTKKSSKKKPAKGRGGAPATKADITHIENRIEKSAKGLRVEIKRDISQLGLYIEKVNDNVALLAEGYGILEKKIDGVAERVDANTEIVAKILLDMGIAKEDIEFIKHGLKRRVDIDEFASLERRVTVLERKR